MVVRIQHLFFSKVPKSSWNAVKNAQRILSRCAEVKSSIQDRNDRNDEFWLYVEMNGLKFRVYDYRGAFRFAIGEAVGTGAHDLKNRKFPPNHKFEWQTTLRNFCKFTQTMETVLGVPGEPDNVRAYFDVEIGSLATIHIKVQYEQLPTAVLFNVVKNKLAEGERDFGRYFGVVPPAEEKIVFH